MQCLCLPTEKARKGCAARPADTVPEPGLAEHTPAPASDAVSIPGVSAAPGEPLMHFNAWQLTGKELRIKAALKELS